MPRTERVLVTGGAGFIGSHVVDAFLERGADVLVVDDLSAGTEANLDGGAPLEVLDIVDLSRLAATVESFRPTVVCHLAAQASVTVSVESPEHDLAVNVQGTLNVCETARRNGARVVFASTGGALYGDGAPVPTAENVQPEPLAPYGASKLAAEAYVSTWGRLYGLPNLVLRLGNVYGPRQSPHGEAGVVAIFSHRLALGEVPTVYGDGTQTRDYVHVRDVARAFVLAVEETQAGTFNVGSGRETSVLELLDLLREAAGTDVEPRYEALRPGELKRSALDSSAIVSALGWRPEIELAEGLRETFSAYRGGAASRRH